MDDDELGDDVEPAETDGQRQVRTLVAGLAVALLSAEVGLAVPGAGGAVLGAATGSLLPALEVMRQRARGRVERTVEGGVARAEMTAEDFTAWVAADARHQGLLLAVVEAAARSTAEVHLDALARVLADGIRAGVHDDARVDESTLIAGALGAFGHAHVQVLALLAEEDPQAVREGSTSAYALGHVAVRRRHLAASVDALAAVLVAHGAVARDTSRWDRIDAAHYAVTAFGRGCLRYLDDRAASDGGDGSSP